MNKLGKSQEGSALIIVIVAIIVLSGASAAFLAITVHRNRESVTARDYTIAFYAAEAGVSASFSEISADQDYDSDGKGDVTGTFDGGNYSVTATDDGNDLWTITANGAYKGYSRNIELVIGRKVSSPFSKGVFAGTSLSMGGNVWSDSYDSDDGTYDSQLTNGHAGENGSVGSNGNIVVDGNAVVYGDATPGPSGSVTGGGEVTGSIDPASEPEPIDPYVYDPPAGTPSAYTQTGGTVTWPAGTYHYASVTLSGHATLNLGQNDGDVLIIYIDGDLLISGQAEVTVTSGASVTIHHGGTSVHVGDPDINLSGQGITNDNGLPSSLIIYSAADYINIAGKSDFHGAIYAPNAYINFAGNADYYGAIVGNQVSCAGSGKGGLHYDEALARLNLQGQVGYEAKSWREF